jgi:predicted GNAT superfamily acetyltransferase
MERFIDQIEAVDKESFDENMWYDRDTYKEILGHAGTVITTLLEGDEIIGYSLAYPIDDEIDELIENGDNNLEEYRNQPKTAYSETFAIKPSHHDTGSARSFHAERLEALRSAGYTKLILHARQTTMSPFLQKVFRYTPKRTVTEWFEGESFDFYEIDLI